MSVGPTMTPPADSTSHLDGLGNTGLNSRGAAIFEEGAAYPPRAGRRDRGDQAMTTGCEHRLITG